MKKQKGFIDEGMLKFVLWVFVVAIVAVTIVGWEAGKWIITHITWGIK
jgi:hypothetical protein